MTTRVKKFAIWSSNIPLEFAPGLSTRHRGAPISAYQLPACPLEADKRLHRTNRREARNSDSCTVT